MSENSFRRKLVFALQQMGQVIDSGALVNPVVETYAKSIIELCDSRESLAMDVLRRLVDLKFMKEQEGKTQAYLVAQPIAWKDAFSLVFDNLTNMPENKIEIPINAIHCKCPTCKTEFDVIPPNGTMIRHTLKPYDVEGEKNIKRHLGHLKAYRKEFIRLMGCSEVYGDAYFTKEKLQKLDEHISEIEDLLSTPKTQQ